MHDIASPRNSVTQRKASRQHPSPATGLEISTGRVRDIAALHGLGFSYREIAEHYKVTPQAISLLLIRSKRKIEAIGGVPSMATLSTRAVSALRSIGIYSPQDAQDKEVLLKLQRARNCGKKTLAEVNQWLNSERD